jgi:hypothetical protein
MRNEIEFGCSSRSRQIICLMVFVALVAGPPANAQKKQPSGVSAPKYDLQTETKIKGTVDEVKLPPKGSEKEIAYLVVVVKEGANPVDVYLCPKTFLDDMGMSFAKGDEITMTGSKVKQGDADLFLVREIAKGNDTFVLRDPKGDPVWSWHH